MRQTLRPSLNLPRLLMLLAIDSVQGRMRPASGLQHGLIGAGLVELAWHGRISYDGTTIVVTHARETGDAILDSVLAALRHPPDMSLARAQVLHVARQLYDIQDRILNALECEGVLRREQSCALGISGVRYPLLLPGYQIELRAQIRQAILFATETTESLAALVALLRTCELLGAVLSRREAWQSRGRLARLWPADTTTYLLIEMVDQLVRDSEGMAYLVGIG